MDFLFEYKHILDYYKKKINEKSNLKELQPKGNLYNQIQNDYRLGSWHKNELKNFIIQKGNEIINNLKTKIINENDKKTVLSNLNLLKNTNSFFIRDKNQFEKEINLFETNLNLLKKNPNILTNYHNNIIFKKRINNSFRFKPTSYLFLSNKNSINLIIKRYNKTILLDSKSNEIIKKIIYKNIKKYKETSYTKPWNSLININKKRNKYYYLNITKIDKKTFLEIVDLLLSIIRDDDISFFNQLHLKIGLIFNNISI